MESGNVVEYIDSKKIICAVVLEVKNQRLRLLTETNREVNLSASRLSHKCKMRLDPSILRSTMVHTLKEIASQRNALISHINIKELWEVLNTEQEWIDLDTMTGLCFPESPSCDHESAVVRAFFSNRLYFKFDHDRFFPNTQHQVEQKIVQERETAHSNRMIKEGGEWLKNVLNDTPSSPPENKTQIINILKSFYLFQKENGVWKKFFI